MTATTERLDAITARLHIQCADCGKCRIVQEAEEWCGDCEYYSCEHGPDCADPSPDPLRDLLDLARKQAAELEAVRAACDATDIESNEPLQADLVERIRAALEATP